MTENYLEAYDDVFADIVNVLLFHGQRLITPEALAGEIGKTMYKADGRLHEQERDISKFWHAGHVRIALYGFENQSKVHPYMPLRIMGYDGASYREQLLDTKQKRKYPVITLVLHFGTERPWKTPTRLGQCLRVPEELRQYFSDYTINVFDIAFLPDEQIAQFTSDFRIVADYFSQIRKNGCYEPSQEEMKHVDAVLKLMSVMTGDENFTHVQEWKEGEVHTMSGVLDQAIQKGRSEGRIEGQKVLADAIRRLNAGETAQHLLDSGVDTETVELALTFKYPASV